MESLWRWLYRKFGARYLFAYGIFAAFAAFVITLGTIGIFSLYQEHTKEEFLRVWVFTDACVLFSLGTALLRLRHEIEPITGWIRGNRDEASSVEAWRCAIALPLRFVTRGSWQPALSPDPSIWPSPMTRKRAVVACATSSNFCLDSAPSLKAALSANRAACVRSAPIRAKRPCGSKFAAGQGIPRGPTKA